VGVCLQCPPLPSPPSRPPPPLPAPPRAARDGAGETRGRRDGDREPDREREREKEKEPTSNTVWVGNFGQGPHTSGLGGFLVLSGKIHTPPDLPVTLRWQDF